MFNTNILWADSRARMSGFASAGVGGSAATGMHAVATSAGYVRKPQLIAARNGATGGPGAWSPPV